jgi:DNA-binding beta-propeller fold protein YncE
LWVANRDDSNVTAVDTKTWQTIAVMPAGAVAYRVKFLHNGKYAMVSNGNGGTLGIYDVASHKKINEVNFTSLQNDAQPDAKGEKPKQPVPGGITVSEDSRTIFVSVTGYQLAAMIDTASWRIIGFFLTGNTPDGIYYAR